jgi:hypothetical protein
MTASGLVNETNSISEAMHAFRESIDYSAGAVPLESPDLVKVVRLRLLTEPGYPYVDVSYCYGILRDGTHVRVQMPSMAMPRRWREWLVTWGREHHVFVKRLGCFDPDVVSVMW